MRWTKNPTGISGKSFGGSIDIWPTTSATFRQEALHLASSRSSMSVI